MLETATPVGLFHFMFAVLAFVWGACLGSFLNVCIYRIPRELSVVKPRSHCPHCGKMIPWYLNIPLVSYLALRGKCRYCGVAITSRYFVVELLVGVLFLLVWLKFDFQDGTRLLGLVPITDWRLVPVYWLMLSGLVLGTFVDFEHLIIPDRVSLGGIVAGVLLSAAVPSLHGATTVVDALRASALGAAVGWGSLWAVGVIGKLMFRKEAMGFGDVKLLGAIGAFAGWQGVLFTIVGSSLFGSLVGVTLVLTGRKAMQSRIPYGPYLALAALLWVFWGPALVDLYIRLLLPTPPISATF
jgi:leader peptidase (prepilin peptidase)/N-methyltransferase